MLQKRIDEKLQYYRDRKKHLPEMKERLQELTAVQAKLEKQIAREKNKSTKSGKKKQKTDLPDSLATPTVTTAPTATNEKLALKLRKVKNLTAEISQLEADIESIENGKELLEYQMEAGRFLFDYEQEKQVEQRATAEMKRAAPTVSKLGLFLDRLPSTSAPHGPDTAERGNDHTASPATSPTSSAVPDTEDFNLFTVLQPNLGKGAVTLSP